MKKTIIFTAILLGLFSCESSEDRALENFYKSQPKDPALIGAWIYTKEQMDKFKSNNYEHNKEVLRGEKFGIDGRNGQIYATLKEDGTENFRIPEKGDFLFYTKNDTIHTLFPGGGFKYPTKEMFKYKYLIRNDTLWLHEFYVNSPNDKYSLREFVRYKENK